jgi:fibronectin type 3 domain-containing protein
MNIRKLSFSSLLFSLLALVLTGCPEIINAVTKPPPTPNNFTATAASATAVNLSWSSSQGATGYKLERKTGTAAFAQIALPNGTNYADTGLTGNTAYTYRLIANNLNGDSAGIEATVTTQTVTTATAPAAPTNFAATATSSTAISLSWTASTGATGYKLERKTGTAAYAQIATPTANSYADSGLTSNTAYSYRLVASNSVGNSTAVEVSVTTPTVVVGTVPAIPTSFVANATSSSEIALSWGASTGATGYKLERKTGSAAFAQIALPNTTTYADTGLTDNTAYSYRLVGTNSIGDSPAVEVTATTKTVVVGSVPSAPTDFVATANSDTSISLTWTASTNATSYKLERKDGAAAFTQIATPTTTSYNDTGLTTLTTYTYRLTASNATGDSPTAEVSATTLTNLPYGPDTCKFGYVWREVIPEDHVCVTGDIRSQVAAENLLVDERRSATDRTYGLDTCVYGYVWREAFPGDNVCVPGTSRDQAAADNAAARSRFVVEHEAPLVSMAYGLDTCKYGYVWRDAILNDRVCVTGIRRSEVAAENALATERRSPTDRTYGIDTCVFGYVWREAFEGDHVCVPGTSRDLSVTENAAARGLFVIAHNPPKISMAYGLDTCKFGYVWREAISDDHVCVTGDIRTQTALENTLITERRSTTDRTYGLDTCVFGYVWREAFAGDNVCVPGTSRDQAATDNAAARSRFVLEHDPLVVSLAYGVDTCKFGYVWRETVPNDHVCVTGTRRSEVATENALADERRSPTGGASGPDTCLVGFVWREASSTDHVCVPGDSRALVATENALAPDRFILPHIPLAF